MKKLALAAALALFAVAVPAATPARAAAPHRQKKLHHAEQSLLDAVNRVRAQNGLRPLALDRRLEQAAQAHVQNLLADGAFTHDFLRNGGSYPFSTWIGWYYRGFCAGENLAQGMPGLSAAAAVQMWLSDAPHRANMLSTAYTTVGVELAGSGGRTIAATDFGGC
jgi:uncharacterized protein YkwD